MPDVDPAFPCRWDTGPARKPGHWDRTGKAWLLAELEVAFLDQLRPLVGIGANHLCEVVGRARAYFEADALEFGDDVRLGERTARIGVELRHERRGGGRRREQAGPGADDVTRHPGLGDRRQLRERLGALR